MIVERLTSFFFERRHRAPNSATSDFSTFILTLLPSERWTCDRRKNSKRLFQTFCLFFIRTFSGGDRQSASGAARHCSAMKTKYVSIFKYQSVYSLLA